MDHRTVDPGFIDELATFIRSDLTPDGIIVLSEQLNCEKENCSSPDLFFSRRPKEEGIQAVVWINRSPQETADPIDPSDSAEEGERLLIKVFFPPLDLTLHRNLPLSERRLPGAAPIAAVISGMIRREYPRLNPQSLDRPGKGPSTDQTTDTAPSEEIGADPQAFPENPNISRKLGVDVMAAYAFFPQTKLHMTGFSSHFNYFPLPPLAVHLGLAYYHSILLSDKRYNYVFDMWPISIGGNYINQFDKQEVNFDFSMLADVTRFRISDSYDRIPDRSVIKVNVGIQAGVSYYYYPYNFMGIGLGLNLAYVPRTQEYLVEEGRLFSTGHFSMRLMFGLIFDFLR